MSEPSVTRTPASSRCRTGQTPEMMLMFESAQWTATTPCSRMARSSSSSEWTQCAMRVWSFHRPNLSYVSQYRAQPGLSSRTHAISFVLSERCDWT